MNSDRETAIFLFAHQDDEAGVFQKIIDELKMGRRTLCLYLTDGAANGQSIVARNQESIAVLSSLGVARIDIIFAGQEIHIRDSELLNHLARAQNWLEGILIANKNVKALYLPAWEGGHHDHDALHAVAIIAATKAGLQNCSRQYSLYNAFHCVGPLFRVFLPLKANGPTIQTTISWSNRLRFLRLCLSYPSQRVTWIGLFPFVLQHYLVWGSQLLQPISLERISERPHHGPLYYERRKFCTYAKLSQKIKNHLTRELG
jgi:LmbE family N-acetylglucosaminyl deacetylase